MSFIKNMSDQDVLALFSEGDNCYVKNMVEKAETERICKGKVT